MRNRAMARECCFRSRSSSRNERYAFIKLSSLKSIAFAESAGLQFAERGYRRLPGVRHLSWCPSSAHSGRIAGEELVRDSLGYSVPAFLFGLLICLVLFPLLAEERWRDVKGTSLASMFQG